MRRKTTLTVLFVGFLAIGARAQVRPDFSGTWTLVGPSRQSPRVGSRHIEADAPLGDRFVVRQDGGGLVMTSRDPEAALIAGFDGSAMTSRTAQPAADVDAQTVAFWNGDRLVIVARSDQGRGDNSVMSIDDDGTLVWQWTPPGPKLPGTNPLTFKYRKG